MPEPRPQKIMKMAQNAQAELQKAQENLDKIEVEGVVGRRAGQDPRHRQGPILGVDIDDSLLAAVRKGDARGSDRRGASTMPGPRPIRPPTREMQKMTSGLPLPPGFKLPF